MQTAFIYPYYNLLFCIYWLAFLIIKKKRYPMIILDL